MVGISIQLKVWYCSQDICLFTRKLTCYVFDSPSSLRRYLQPNSFPAIEAFDLFFINFFLKLFFETTEIFDKETAASMFRKGQVLTIKLSRIFESVFCLKRRPSRLTEHPQHAILVWKGIIQRFQWYNLFVDWEGLWFRFCPFSICAFFSSPKIGTFFFATPQTNYMGGTSFLCSFIWV